MEIPSLLERIIEMKKFAVLAASALLTLLAAPAAFADPEPSGSPTPSASPTTVTDECGAFESPEYCAELERQRNEGEPSPSPSPSESPADEPTGEPTPVVVSDPCEAFEPPEFCHPEPGPSELPEVVKNEHEVIRIYAQAELPKTGLPVLPSALLGLTSIAGSAAFAAFLRRR